MGFSRQEYWSGLPCPPPGDLPDPGIKPVSLMSACTGRQVLICRAGIETLTWVTDLGSQLRKERVGHAFSTCPTLSFHRYDHKSVLYVSVSIPALQIDSSAPGFLDSIYVC